MATAFSTRRARRWAANEYRWLSAPRRALPDFLVIGAQKAGTTSLYRWLTDHSQVVCATTAKELHYFDSEPRRWPVRYRRHFPRRSAMASGVLSGGRPAITGEATPSYLFHPAVPERVGDLVPGVKLVVVLRNPVDRAISHHAMNVRKGFESLPLLDAIEAEEGRIAEGRRLAMSGRPLHRSHPYLRFSYLERGLYAIQLRRWLAQFPRQQLLVLEAGALFSRPDEEFATVLEFLGLDPAPLADSRNHNPGGHDSTSASERAVVGDLFVGPNAELDRLIGITWP